METVDLHSRSSVGLVSNEVLSSVWGLSGITEIEGYLVIKNNTSLSQLNGLEGLLDIGSYLSIESNDMLTDVMALHGLQSIAGKFEVIDNLLLSVDSVTALYEAIGEENISGEIIISGNGGN